MKIAVFATAFLALMQLGLAMNISAMRWKYRRSVGAPSDTDHPLSRMSTAFRNCSEWHPTLMALMLLLPMGGAPNWSVWLPVCVVTARSLHVIGLATFPLSRPNAARALGAGMSYLLLLAYALLLFAAYS